ncbi:hypothetical protein [Nostoc sp. PA-18-2419]|uniref:hypothetical protein n=1 Tax=Nostoc sp. PA-18-2419 TaxID=2575443 RepID=UPI001108C5F8|nr:hypothetical protein [Nostoc sp. PA-18-2419]
MWTPSQGLTYALQGSNPQQNAHLLTELVNYLPPNLKELALEKALAAAQQIQSEEYRAQALAALALPLSMMPTTLLFSNWQQTLHELSLRTRQDLLKNIEVLVPVIFALGNQSTIAKVNCAIQEWH